MWASVWTTSSPIEVSRRPCKKRIVIEESEMLIVKQIVMILVAYVLVELLLRSFLADLEGREVDVDSRDVLAEGLKAVVRQVALPGDPELEVHEVSRDLVHIYVIINTCVIINSDIVIPAPSPVDEEVARCP